MWVDDNDDVCDDGISVLNIGLYKFVNVVNTYTTLDSGLIYTK